ncbi:MULTISPECIES: hypothetical protein [Psychrobacter]|jgi:hypothetical protein|uniref:hypothetical protein n=1 Tax=Psychrobacter TaxID=497 RepID=UPI0008A6FE6B|nr:MULTISPECIES: hypothetical protein [Psychrobacter]AOY44292.1 hypothetical protein AOT82_1913 [Psychrobacter sp. AntiMn-1]HBL96219.1 hypothetical protein [Psychrobacter sp.]|tara:strand:+ start:93 stop:611 length:519 start_codon:yes stop_codon:yes gene_type:complete
MKLTAIIFSMVAALSLTSCATRQAASTDWTPYLKSMQKGCDYPNPTTSSLPIAYQQSIIDTDTRIKPYNSSDEEQLEHLDETITTYTLNNATAFGKQLSKIEYLSGFEWSHLKLYFANNPQSLRSGFTLPVDKHDINTVTKNDSSGYQVTGEGFTHLTFDKKDNSIACGFGV